VFGRCVLKRGHFVGVLVAIAAIGGCPGSFDSLRTQAARRACAAECCDTAGKVGDNARGSTDRGTRDRPPAPKGLKGESELPSRYPYVVQDILRYCEPNKGFWVDLGAGRGQLTIPLIEATGNPVLMIDPDVEAMQEGLALAREKAIQDRLLAVVGVAEALPLPDESVDLLVSRGSIFFWDDQAKGLEEVYRVLRPGGKAMIGGGAGSGYPAWATEKLIQHRKSLLEGEESQKWRHFVKMRRPEQMKAWAQAAALPDYTVMGHGALSAADRRVGQGVWILLEKPSEPSRPEGTTK